MSNIKSLERYCNCNVSYNKDILLAYVNNSFCQHCGCILLKESNGTIHYTLKQKQNIIQSEFNPIKIIKNMKKKTEKYYPNIYNIYNNPDSHDSPETIKDDESMKSINIYLKYRKMLLTKLQKLIKKFDYFDSTFYQCLFFLDTFLSHDITFEMSEKKILYYLVGYFLCSTKLKESDIYEPNFDSFFELKKGIYLSSSKIAQYEILCLKRINYNAFSFSVHDWITQLISNGIVFNSEIDKSNETLIINGHRHTLINTINKYSIKLLLFYTSKDIFFKYAPMYIAFSIIQISREKYLSKNRINNQLFFKLIDLYGINYKDYKKCYEDLKSEKMESNNQTRNLKDSNINKDIKQFSVDNCETNFNNKENIYQNNYKMKSSKDLIYVKDNLINENNQKYKKEEFHNNNRNSKIKRKVHLSIDCQTNILESNDTLPFININSHKELIKLNPIITKSNRFLTIENEQKNQDNKESYNKLKPIRLRNNRYKTTKKLDKINLDKSIHDEINNVNNIELIKENINNNVKIVRRHSKLKTYHNFQIKDNTIENK